MTNYRSATRELFNTRSKLTGAEARSFSFPKQSRILHSSEFRKVYDEGMRAPATYLVAFCLAREEPNGPRVGLTVPRSHGNAVVRNRIKRRIREVVRMQLWKADSQWDIVINPRKTALKAPMRDLERDLDKVFRRCKSS